MVQKKRMPYNEERVINSLKQALQTVKKLRAPDGCPWDKEQTHLSLRPFLIEEAYETLEVLDQVKSPKSLEDPKIKQAFIDEWGDVLLQILLHAEIASETYPDITFEQIAQNLNDKLIRRHPHVFSTADAKTSAEVIKNWDQIKKQEKGIAEKPTSVFDSVPKSLPPLPRTMKVIQKVTKVGFQWPDLSGPVDKLSEEVAELKAELSKSDLAPDEYLKNVESEVGDVLFSVCNIASFLKIDPDGALRETLRKFESRFRYIETELTKRGKTPEQSTLEEMDEIWNLAKKEENQ